MTMEWEDCYANYQRRRGLSLNTIDTRRRTNNLWGAWLNAHQATVWQAERRHVEGWMDERLHLVPKTLHANLSNLRALYAWGLREGWCEGNPTDGVESPKVRRGVPRPIPERDLADALHFANPRMRVMLTLMAFGGLRCMEVAALEVGHLNFDAKVMRVLGKGNKERIVPLHPEIIRVLEEYGLPRSGFVLRRSDGGRMHPHTVSHAVGSFMAGLGLSASAHMLRHRFGTYATREGGILNTMVLLGHESPSTTAIYAKVFSADLAATVCGIPTAEGTNT